MDRQSMNQMEKKSLKDAALEIPWVYNAVQFAFGTAELDEVVSGELQAFAKHDVLELGSGTGGFSPDGFAALTVTDVNQAYLDQIQVPCTKVVVDAAVLPFENDRFDLVFAVGLYHHISDDDYLRSMREVRRVLWSGGVFINLDNLPPTRPTRVVASVVRKMDRGRFVRTVARQRELMQTELVIDDSRVDSYAWCKLEYVVHRCRKPIDHPV